MNPWIYEMKWPVDEKQKEIKLWTDERQTMTTTTKVPPKPAACVVPFHTTHTFNIHHSTQHVR